MWVPRCTRRLPSGRASGRGAPDAARRACAEVDPVSPRIVEPAGDSPGHAVDLAASAPRALEAPHLGGLAGAVRSRPGGMLAQQEHGEPAPAADTGSQRELAAGAVRVEGDMHARYARRRGGSGDPSGASKTVRSPLMNGPPPVLDPCSAERGGSPRRRARRRRGRQQAGVDGVVHGPSVDRRPVVQAGLNEPSARQGAV